MPTHTDGGNAVIEQPLSNITDGDIGNSRRDRALYGTPFGDKLKHIEKMDRTYSGQRQTKADRITAAQERKGEAAFRRGHIIRDLEKRQMKVTPAATAEPDAEDAEANEEIATLTKQKIPVLDSVEVRRKAPQYAKWRRHTKTYFDGDTRHPDDRRKAARGERLEKERAVNDVLHASRPSEDAVRSMRVDLQVHAEKGKPSTGLHLLGSVLDTRGNYVSNRSSQTEFPETLSKSNQFSEDLAMVDDALNFFIWANFDSVAAKLEKQIREEARDADAISDKDRPVLLSKAKAELLEAQRAEEFCNVQCERAGIPVFRPSDWPLEVLLEVERPTTPTNGKPKPAPVLVEDADDEPDFEDDGDDA